MIKLVENSIYAMKISTSKLEQCISISIREIKLHRLHDTSSVIPEMCRFITV